MSAAVKRRLRCAVYTRKSSEEGLDQEYNSIDAQRDAGHAYIASQRAEGWIALPTEYDDGGFSGGTLERPALQRLLADIEAGRRNATSPVLLRMAEVYNCPVVVLERKAAVPA